MTSILEKKLSGITPASIEKYLFLTGWTKDVKLSSPKRTVFQNKSDAGIRIATPAVVDVSDYYLRVYDLVSFLSGYTNSSETEVVNSLKNAYVDRMQFRIIAESSKSGMIPLDYAARCIEGLKELVLYAACAEEKACPICVRTLNNAKERLERFQFNQTEVGSFIFNVGVQVVDEENEQLCMAEIEPPLKAYPEHKIVKRIANAISQINDVVERKVKLADLVENAYKDGITANMCDALSMLKPENEDIELETSIHYATALTRTIVAPYVSTFDSMHFLLLDEISKRYKDCTLIEDATLVGTIKMLSKSSTTSDVEIENTVRLLTKIDNRPRAVNLHLSPENHALACDAYRDDKEVEVSGVVDKSGKYWFFSEVTSFTVLD